MAQVSLTAVFGCIVLEQGMPTQIAELHLDLPLIPDMLKGENKFILAKQEVKIPHYDSSREDYKRENKTRLVITPKSRIPSQPWYLSPGISGVCLGLLARREELHMAQWLLDRAGERLWLQIGLAAAATGAE